VIDRLCPCMDADRSIYNKENYQRNLSINLQEMIPVS
jgi:hypothetical protein